MTGLTEAPGVASLAIQWTPLAEEANALLWRQAWVKQGLLQAVQQVNQETVQPSS